MSVAFQYTSVHDPVVLDGTLSHVFLAEASDGELFAPPMYILRRGEELEPFGDVRDQFEWEAREFIEKRRSGS